MAMGGIPIGEWSGSDAVEALHQSIKEFNEQTSTQTEQMLRLTKAIMFLTVVLTIGLGIQIYIALYVP